MKPDISRRHMYEHVVRHMNDMRFERMSTRKGKTDDLFHVDGKGVVGRGTVQTTPVTKGQLETVYTDVYQKKSKDRWVHFSWGGYTKDARTFANSNRIALFEFRSDGTVTPISTPAQGLDRNRLSNRWKTQLAWVIVGLVVAALCVLAFIAFPTVRWVVGGVAVLAVLTLVFAVIEFVNPNFGKSR